MEDLNFLWLISEKENPIGKMIFSIFAKLSTQTTTTSCNEGFTWTCQATSKVQQKYIKNIGKLTLIKSESSYIASIW